MFACSPVGGRFPAGRAFRYNPSLRAERGNLLNILLNKLAKPGFPLQSLTQIDLRFLIYDYFYNFLAIFAYFLCALGG